MGIWSGYIPIYVDPDIILQKSGNNFFVRQSKDKNYKANQYIGEEHLTMFRIAGMTIKIVDWLGKTIQTINY